MSTFELVTCLLLSLLGLTVAGSIDITGLPTSTTTSSSCDSIKVNFHELINKVHESLPDPIPMADKDELVKLTEGKVWGLNKFTVKEPVTVLCQEGKLTLEFEAEAENVRGTYEWEKEILGRKRNGIVYIGAEKSVSKVKASRDVNGKVTLDIDITRLDGINVRVTGLDYLTWFASRIVTHVSNFFPTTFGDALEEQLTVSLEEALKDLPL